MVPAPRAALFVINQDASPAILQGICHARHHRSVVVLTTHRVFPFELEDIRQVAEAVIIACCVDYLTEADMDRCDELATERLTREKCLPGGQWVESFIAHSLEEKNRIVHRRLSEHHGLGEIYYSPGLGVSATYWEAIGQPLPPQPGTATAESSPAMRDGNKSRLRRSTRRVIKSIRDAAGATVHGIWAGGTCYAFVSPLKRLKTQQEARFEPLRHATRTLRAYMVLRAAVPAAALNTAMALALRRHLGEDSVVSMTIHDYDSALAQALGNVSVFVDGYHPSNYPRSYIDLYGDETFVVRTMYDSRWFSAHGKKTGKPPAFLEREYFTPSAVTAARRVLVALNHAGDWTALINRSDTDDLISAAVSLARRHRDLSFRLRLHPTMTHPAHEGTHSVERVQRYVRSENLSNLEISTGTLADDVSWCEICLSEYSQVLLDAMQRGKLGVSVNLTKRRSFMQDYQELGFFSACNLEDLSAILRLLSEETPRARQLHNRAVRRYNELLAEWLGDASLDLA